MENFGNNTKDVNKKRKRGKEGGNQTEKQTEQVAKKTKPDSSDQIIEDPDLETTSLK